MALFTDTGLTRERESQVRNYRSFIYRCSFGYQHLFSTLGDYEGACIWADNPPVFYWKPTGRIRGNSCKISHYIKVKYFVGDGSVSAIFRQPT